ncbi:MAG: hypothetical protein ACXWJ8_12145 [Xanthobacteraceae bacterium]
MVIDEAAVAIAARRSVGALELSILVARTPFWFVARLPLARSFAAIAMTFVRRVASRNELRLRFIDFTVAKPILSIAMTRVLLALAGPGAPLSLVGFAVAMPGHPITILFDHAVIVVLRTLAARFVRHIFAPMRRLLLAPRFAIAKFFSAPSHGTIGGPFFGVV